MIVHIKVYYILSKKVVLTISKMLCISFIETGEVGDTNMYQKLTLTSYKIQ